MILINKIKKHLALILVVSLLIPANISFAAAADTSMNASESGFMLSAEWGESEYKDGTKYKLVQTDNTSEEVRLRITYENKKVNESGYAPGDLIITVKGIGGVNRNGKLEAVVGADKEDSNTKTRDWSYTYNKSKDTYTFTNNNRLRPNSVVSGYFDMIWTVPAIDSIHGYKQNNIVATLYDTTGDSVKSQTLSFTNETKCNTYEVDITTEKLYSAEGLTSGISNPDDYAFIKYNLMSDEDINSRGLAAYRFTFDPDVENVGTGAIVISSSNTKVKGSDDVYTVDMDVSNHYKSNYIYVAYPLDSYGSVAITAKLELNGKYYEGSDTGQTDELILAEDEITLTVPADFSFDDPVGNSYDFKKTSQYSNSEGEETGDIAGKKLVKGTKATFYLSGAFNKPVTDKSTASVEGDTYEIEIVDDFMYITQKGGTYRQLDAGEYSFTNVRIPAVTELADDNGNILSADKYNVKIYAFQNGATANTKDATPYQTVKIGTSQQNVTLPDNTTAIAIRIEGVDVSIKSFSFPVGVNFHINDTSALEESKQDNLTDGQLINTSFILVSKDGNLINKQKDDSLYEDPTNLNLAQKDIDTYGKYLHRKKAEITFYGSDKSDYYSTTYLTDIQHSGNNFTSNFTMCGNFSFDEVEVPDKFSLYTILEEDVSIRGYENKEDLMDVFKITGLGLTQSQLHDNCEIEVIENYKDSGRTYIACHFDLEGIVDTHKDTVKISFPVNIKKQYFTNGGNTVTGQSCLIIDRSLDEYTSNKDTDNGEWFRDDIAADIDNDGDTEEYLASSRAYETYIYADSSELQMSKYVKTSNIDDFVQLPDVPLAEQGSEYTYELSVRNGASITEDLVITDILETGGNSQWKGTFKNIDISDAEEKGLTGTVWYSEKTDPGEVGGRDWSRELEPDKVKAVAVDFGDSQLDSGKELSIFITMTAPSDDSLKNKITENGFSAAFTMRDATSGDITSSSNLDSNLVQVILSAELKTLIITKVDKETYEVLPGAKFVLFEKGSDEPAFQGETNALGRIRFKDVPADKEYVLKELLAPEGYELCEDIDISFDENEVEAVTVQDARKTGKVAINKTNALNKYLPVEGAEFTLYKKDGTKVDSAFTDINGRAVFEGLAWGEYYIKETKAPEGYTIIEDTYDFEINAENVSSTKVLNIQNGQENDTKVTLKKYESTTAGMQTDIPMEGVSFRLYETSSGQDILIGTYVTDNEGEIIVEELAYGEYRFEEYKTPKGFIKAEDVTFTLSVDETEKTLSVYNKRKAGSISIYKVNSYDTPVEGAIFDLYDKDKVNIIGTYETDENGNILIEDLDWNTYYFKERYAPEGYLLDETWHEVTIDKDTLAIDKKLVNEVKKGSVTLTKTNEIGTSCLEGAEFTLYKNDGTVIRENLTTDEKGQITVSGLDWGTYYFKETKAPAGYSMTDETIRFAVNSANAGYEQEITATNPQLKKTITITKKIFVNDVNYANGDPTFLFKITGTDVDGKDHTYYRVMKFDESYVSLNTDEETKSCEQSVTVSGLVAGSYTVTEEETSRYKYTSITGSDNVTVNNGSEAVVDLTTEEEGEVKITNRNYEQSNFSDNKSVANIIKEQKKMTALKAEWLKDPQVEANSVIDKDSVRVTVLYDDGTIKTLSSDDWSFGDSVIGEKFPNDNGDYEIPVVYAERNITKYATFSVTITGAVDKKIVRLEAAVRDDFSEVYTGSKLDTAMFDIVAVYNTGEKETLSEQLEDYSFHYSIPAGTGYNQSATVVEETYDGASSLLLKFDKDMTATQYDQIFIYDKDGELIKHINTDSYYSYSIKGDVAAGQTMTIPSSGVKVVRKTTTSNTSNLGTVGLTITPLDAEGNILLSGTDKVVLDPGYAPGADGSFDVTISLNPDQYEENVSTTVSMLAVEEAPVLMNGSFVNSKIPSSATKVLFTDETAPSDATCIDLSYKQDGSVMAWSEGTTFKISTQKQGVKVIANSDAKKMFASKTKLTEIDLTYLDTSDTVFFDNMFYRVMAETIDVSSLDTSSGRSFSAMFQGTTGSIEGLESFDTSKGRNFSNMFKDANGSIRGIDGWDVSSGTDFSGMFYYAGTSSVLTIDGGLDLWDMSSAQNLCEMFYYAGTYGFDIGDIGKWDVSNVTSISNIFAYAGRDVDIWDVGDLSRKTVTSDDGKTYTAWDFKKLKDASYAFRYVGNKGGEVKDIGFSTWQFGQNDINFSGMFYYAGIFDWTGDSLSSWLSHASYMDDMFYGAGHDYSSSSSRADESKEFTLIFDEPFSPESISNFVAFSSVTMIDISGMENTAWKDFGYTAKELQASDTADMFNGCYGLEEITVGDQFLFHDNNLLPDTFDINNGSSSATAKRYWYAESSSLGYLPEDIPAFTADTYRLEAPAVLGEDSFWAVTDNYYILTESPVSKNIKAYISENGFVKRIDVNSLASGTPDENKAVTVSYAHSEGEEPYMLKQYFENAVGIEITLEDGSELTDAMNVYDSAGNLIETWNGESSLYVQGNKVFIDCCYQYADYGEVTFVPYYGGEVDDPLSYSPEYAGEWEEEEFTVEVTEKATGRTSEVTMMTYYSDEPSGITDEKPVTEQLSWNAEVTPLSNLPRYDNTLLLDDINTYIVSDMVEHTPYYKVDVVHEMGGNDYVDIRAGNIYETFYGTGSSESESIYIGPDDYLDSSIDVYAYRYSSDYYAEDYAGINVTVTDIGSPVKIIESPYAEENTVLYEKTFDEKIVGFTVYGNADYAYGDYVYIYDADGNQMQLESESYLDVTGNYIRIEQEVDGECYDQLPYYEGLNITIVPIIE